MKTILWLIAAYVAYVLQAAAMPRLPWNEFAPDLLLVVACCAVYAKPGWRGIALAAAIGLLGDCLATGPLGIRMAGATIVAAVIAAMRERLARRSEKWLIAAAWPCLFGVSFVETAARTSLATGRFAMREVAEFAAGRAGGSFAVLIAIVACGAALQHAASFVGAGRGAGERYSFD